ncbi:MAG: right-handed parallel beta-helix repeat-containing protein [Ardenticatenales bacterium]
MPRIERPLGRLAFGAAVTLCLVAGVGLVLAGNGPAGAAGLAPVYVTSTGDGPAGICGSPGHPDCTLRDAIETVALRRADRRILARYCEPGDPGPYCLNRNDPNFDAVAGVWRIVLSEPYGLDITGTNVTIDFSDGVPDWAGAPDNVVEIDTGGGDGLDWAFGIDGAGHELRGFNVRGTVKTAAIVVYNGAKDVTIDSLALAAITGDAIRIRDEQTQRTRVISTQCGWFGALGDGGGALLPTPVTGTCVQISRGAHDNWIVSEDADGQVVPPNTFANAAVGVDVTGKGTRANRVEGNRMDSDGVGVRITGGALETVVRANTIVGGGGNGIEIQGDSWKSVLEENRIGVESDDVPAERTNGNGGWAIDIAAPAKDTQASGNRIQGNAVGGIHIAGRTAELIRLTQNRITGNEGPAVAVEGGANHGILPPELHLSGERVIGRSCPLCVVEVFSDPADEAASYEGSTTADNGGNVVFTPTGPFKHRFITALATDPDGNSSAIAAAVDTVPQPTPTPTATPGGGRVYLPIAYRHDS